MQSKENNLDKSSDNTDEIVRNQVAMLSRMSTEHFNNNRLAQAGVLSEAAYKLLETIKK